MSSTHARIDRASISLSAKRVALCGLPSVTAPVLHSARPNLPRPTKNVDAAINACPSKITPCVVMAKAGGPSATLANARNRRPIVTVVARTCESGNALTTPTTKRLSSNVTAFGARNTQTASSKSRRRASRSTPSASIPTTAPTRRRTPTSIRRITTPVGHASRLTEARTLLLSGRLSKRSTATGVCGVALQRVTSRRTASPWYSPQIMLCPSFVGVATPSRISNRSASGAIPSRAAACGTSGR